MGSGPRSRRPRLTEARRKRPSTKVYWAMFLCGAVPLGSIVAGVEGWLPWHLAGGIAVGALFLGMHMPWKDTGRRRSPLVDPGHDGVEQRDRERE